jgi:dATP/dGTP diphosphohydrolase
MNKTEERIKADTGGEKCAKLAQMADIPASVLLELMEHYGKGREKYPGDATGPNYAKGYPWSLSYNAAMRHLLQFWGGENIDPETGSKHVIAAAWHCLCLALFMDIKRPQDDRWEEKAVVTKIAKLIKENFHWLRTPEGKAYLEENEEEFMN